MTQFFRDLLFDSPGAFTLYGSKPVSSACLYPPSNFSEEEWKEFQKQCPDTIERRYNFEENYRKWKDIEEKFLIRKYLFGTFPCAYVPGVDILFFVNIENTLRLILEHYSDFRRVLGFDFDPFQSVFDVQNRESPFWNGVVHNHALFGIMMGYGQVDSWLFTWTHLYEKDLSPQGLFVKSLPFTFSDDRNIPYPTPQNFPPPIFRTFGLPCSQKLVEKYANEEKKIQSLYKGRDEVDVALEWLTR